MLKIREPLLIANCQLPIGLDIPANYLLSIAHLYIAARKNWQMFLNNTTVRI
ncbi:hypothetical protein [Niastella sp. OAS944]|uniref:hypothetical protein n=1 Tax=Niastella sp. OAS944 TaxID=2664089 RepID=UPI00346B3896|nr:hypothetical protein [Chitinophagaceae bacterium OAS944]